MSAVHRLQPPQALTYRLPSGRRLKLSAEVVRRLWVYAQAEPGSLEAGGLLLGREIIGTTDAVVDEITTPQAQDKRTRTGFERSEWVHQLLANQALERSGYTMGYLGEWHTHPEPVPTPSRTDVEDWHRHACIERRPLVFVIVGQSELRLWCVDPGGRLELGERMGGAE